MSNIDNRKANFLAALKQIAGEARSAADAIYGRDDCIAACQCSAAPAYTVLPAWLVQDPSRRAGRGLYRIPEMVSVEIETDGMEDSSESSLTDPQTCDTITNMSSSNYNLVASMPDVSLVPMKNDTFVPWGHYDDISTILASKQFAPVYITGLSGNGKTTMIEQICANTGRECIRVNITAETDEDDLIGGFRLINGETKFVYGGVVQAMQRGAVLLLDEIDLGTERMMCLQPVLEGKPVYLKKISKWVRPAPGFTVVLTGNTKGLGDDTGKFAGTRVLNNAFLERVNIMLKQEYPKAAVEKKILTKVMESSGCVDDKFADALVRWAEAIRKSYDEGVSEEVITTRRLVQIVNGFCIFGDRLTAVRHGVGRFDDVTAEAFLSLYKKIDEEATPVDADAANAGAAPREETVKTTTAPF